MRIIQRVERAISKAPENVDVHYYNMFVEQNELFHVYNGRMHFFFKAEV
ncbi:hypothetical protein H6504_01540 [Candidatus Woesearchaeota archaeon]|nr:hypothetical protein [Candidatus Woesearchaeota archaeon]